VGHAAVKNPGGLVVGAPAYVDGVAEINRGTTSDLHTTPQLQDLEYSTERCLDNFSHTPCAAFGAEHRLGGFPRMSVSQNLTPFVIVAREESRDALRHENARSMETAHNHIIN